jgi:alpha-tubulin suppressor-like RCC1 family protein
MRILVVLLAALCVSLPPAGASAGHGGINPGFGTAGTAVIPVPGPGKALAIGFQNPNFVVAGTSGTGMFLARLSWTGALDPTFRAGQLVVPELGNFVPQAVNTFPDTRVLVLGRTATANQLVQFTREGALDTTYGNGGIVTLPGPVRMNGNLALLWTQNILVSPSLLQVTLAGEIVSGPSDPVYTPPDSATSYSGLFFAAGPQLWRADGRREPYFTDSLPGNGTAVGSSDYDLRVFQAGSMPKGSGATDLFVRAFFPTGPVDTSFGAGGTVEVDVRQMDEVLDLTVTHDAITVVGSTQRAGGTPHLMVVQLRTDGTLNRSFGNGGVWVSEALSPAGRMGIKAAWGTLIVPGQTAGGAPALVEVDPGAGGVGPAKAWGWNGAGQLGDGTTADHGSPGVVGTLPPSRSVAAGAYHSIAVAIDGSVTAAGWNVLGQLGDGTTTDRHAPVNVAGLPAIRDVSAGMLHSLAVAWDGTVWAWGWNGVGQLGDGTTADRHKPVKVPGLTNVVAVAAGGYHSLALKSDGTVWAWGYNGVGQLGDGTAIDRHAPVQLPLTGVSEISGGLVMSMALSTSGTVSTWGWDLLGELGRTGNPSVPGAVAMPGAAKAVSISAGGIHALAALEDGSVAAWGWNGVGQLGTGTTVDRATPAKVPGIAGITDVSAGTYHSLGVARDGTVFAWGWNILGQLGDGTTVDRLSPVPLQGIAGVRSVAAGTLHSLAF